MGSMLRYLQLLSLIVICSNWAVYLYAQDKRSVHVGALHSSQLRLLKPEGAATVSPAAATVEVKRGEMLFERLNQQAVVTRSVGGVTRNELPYMLYGVGSNGSDLNLGIVVDVEGGGMRASPNAASFVGKLRFGIIDKQNPSSQQVLPSPVSFLVTANVDDISPEALTLDHTNLPFAPLTMSVVSPGDTVSVQIRPSFSATDPVRVEVNVIRPELKIQLSPNRIQGWGLAEADITVEANGIEQPENMRITLDTTNGGLDKTSVDLDKNGVGKAKIRSIGLGRAIIGAKSSRLRSAEAELTFTPPWGFAIAAILGAVIGVLAKTGGSKSRGKRVKIWGLLAGVALGLLGAVAFAVGVNLTGYVPQATVGEALTFFIAGIIAYMGGFAGQP